MNIGAVTCNLVIREDNKKALDRSNNPPLREKDVSEFRSELMIRLKKYKLSKKPSVDNIHDFLKAAEKGTGIIQFAGSSYKLQKEFVNYDKYTPLDLLNGKEFKISYASVQPGDYTRIYVTYSFDKSTSMVMPTVVEWIETNEDGKSENREEILNRPVWLRKNKLDVSNKEATIKKLLTDFKNGGLHNLKKIQTMIDQLRAEGVDWEELNTIEKSVKSELDKKE